MSATIYNKAQIDLLLATKASNPAASIPDGVYGGSFTARSAFRAALGGTLSGTGDTKILCVGDSTTRGIGSGTDPFVNSWPNQLAALLNASYSPAYSGLALPPSYINSESLTADGRWLPGAGWARGGVGFGNGAGWAAQTSTNQLTFTPGIMCDTFDVYYVKDYGAAGTFTAQATGGTSSGTISCSGAAAIAKVTVTAGSRSASNVLTITPTSGSNFYIVAVEARDSTAKAIRIANAGVSGSAANTGWATSNGHSGVDAIKAYAPHLTIIDLGINDAYSGLAAATYSTQVQAIAAAAAVSGSVVLASVVPSQDTAPAALENAYATAMFGLYNANQNSYSYWDTMSRFGGSWANANAQSWMSDAKHPNAAGYTQLAQGALRLIQMLT